MKSFLSSKLICMDVLNIVWDKESFLGIPSCCWRVWSAFPVITSAPIIAGARKMLFPPLDQQKGSRLSLVASGMSQEGG